MSKDKTSAKGKSRKLRLKKESLRDLDAPRKTRRVKGGGATAAAGMICFTQACATAAYTNCNLSCVAVCGGGFKNL